MQEWQRKNYVVINPANGMRVNCWVVYERSNGGFIATDYAGKSFYGNTWFEAYMNRSRNGRLFPILDNVVRGETVTAYI